MTLAEKITTPFMLGAKKCRVSMEKRKLHSQIILRTFINHNILQQFFFFSLGYYNFLICTPNKSLNELQNPGSEPVLFHKCLGNSIQLHLYLLACHFFQKFEQEKYTLQREIELKNRMLESLNFECDSLKQQQSVHLDKQKEQLDRAYGQEISDLKNKVC